MAGRTAAVVTLLLSALLVVLVLPGGASAAAAVPERTAERFQAQSGSPGSAPEGEQENMPGRHRGGSAVLRDPGHRHPSAPSSRRQFSPLVVGAVVPDGPGARPAHVTAGGGLPPSAAQPPTPATLQVFRC